MQLMHQVRNIEIEITEPLLLKGSETLGKYENEQIIKAVIF